MDYNCFCVAFVYHDGKYVDEYREGDYLGTEEITKEEYEENYKKCIELYQKGGY